MCMTQPTGVALLEMEKYFGVILNIFDISCWLQNLDCCWKTCFIKLPIVFFD